MRNWPLAIQIWSVIAAITLGISILLAVLFPWTLRDFFTREIYANIENAQNLFLANELRTRGWEEGIFPDRRQQLESIRTVNHIILLDNGQAIVSSRMPGAFIEKVRQEALEQELVSQRYSAQIDRKNIFYVIRQGEVLGHRVFIVSHMWDTYRNDLVNTLFSKLVSIMGLVFLFSWVPALLLAKFLSKPIITLEEHVRKIAHRDWHNPIELERRDEIGRLGQSIEQLREQIIRQDKAQQSLLQHVSHELKTPVMVIRSYAQSIADGIYPKGDLPGTIQVIEEEANRLEKRIRNLLYLTKLDYLATRKPLHEAFALDQLVEEVVDRLRWQRNELTWSVKLAPVKINGELEQWRVALENLLDNQIRYAREHIAISLEQTTIDNRKAARLRIWNDGPAIERKVMDNLFQQFAKGYKGEFGLGLAIVQRIATLHQATIRAENEEEGVSFILTIPL